MIGWRFGVWYHPDHVYRILKRLGFSYQQPETRAIERNEAAIQQWMTEKIPALKDQMQAGTTVVFLDEAGFSLKTTTRRTWAPRGKTPLVKGRTNWEKLSVIGGLTNTGKFFQHTVSGACRSIDVVKFLQHLLKWISGPIVVVLDNGGIHIARQVKDLLSQHERLKLEFLLPYAPELNPIERVWAWVKKTGFGNVLCKTLSDLKARLQRTWQRLRRLKVQHYTQTGVWRCNVAGSS